jgi:DNA-directed RNA polymerase specialized sigma24 family protein
MGAYVSPAVAASFLADAGTLNFLAAFVRRRVPAPWSEDVVQSVLCSALEASAPPAPHALRGWLAGIARHKIADFHRRARREAPRFEALTDLHAPANGVGASVEARDLLARAEAFVESDRERRTLEWMVRAHEGEALEDIAHDESLPAPLVRQRVTRLRRALRAALLAAAALAIAALVASSGRSRREAIAPESVLPLQSLPRQAAASPLEAVQGRWRVRDVSCGAEAPAAACVAARLAQLDVNGTHATLLLGGVRREALLRVGEDGALRVRIDAEQEHSLGVAVDGDRLRVSTDLGVATLVRTRP